MKNFWEEKIETVYSELDSSASGLTTKQAHEKLKVYGHNTIKDKDKRAVIDIIIAQFANPLVIILLVASFISAYLGDIFDTIIIVIIIVISAVLGFVQEYRSEQVLAKLKKYLSYNVVVLRDRQKIQIKSYELVPGDIVFVRLGDIVQADMRIIETSGIVANEAILTGESAEVEKNASKTTSSATPQDIKNGLFMGTTIVEGYAKAIVVATGENTFFGKTAAVFSSKIPESDFQLGIRKLGNMLIRVIIIITVVIFLANYLMRHGDKNPLVDAALFSLAIAVGIAPEALPAIITVTLSNGSMRLAKKKVVTKKLAAIEDLGNMDVLCTDKTGTLTEEMQVDRYIDLDKKDNIDIFKYAVLCNSAVGTTHFRGSNVDIAIKKYAKVHNIGVSEFTKISEIPFDFVRRRMGQIVKQDKKTLLIVKGTPESILSVCSHVKMDSKLYETSKKREKINGIISEYGSQGYSAICVAYKGIKQKKEYTKEDEKDLIFLGFLLLDNPPKHSVKPTLDRLKKLEIGLKIITGDDGLVTKKLCSVIGFKPKNDRIILGTELVNIEEQKLLDIVEKFDVFARVTPQQKLAIVEALRKNGHVVGFLGDGINDAPALRSADVGISVDSAADVAKGASHIILLQKSLGVVCDGAEEGRKIFGNITKYILNTMSANQGNMVTVALSSFFLPFIPLLPSQILLNNLISDLPLVSVSTDNVDKVYLKKPQKWDMKFIFKFMLFFGLISTFFDIAFIIILYLIMGVDIATLRTAWFLESVLSEMIIVFSLRTHLPFFKSMPSWILVVCSLIASIIAIGVIYVEPIASVFSFVPLSSNLILLTGVILICYFVVTEIGKTVFFSKENLNNNLNHLNGQKN